MRLVSLVVGAGLMYFLDPSNGIRRRQWLRDQAVSFQPLVKSLKEMVWSRKEAQPQEQLAYPDPTTLNADWDHALVTRVEEAVSQYVSPSGPIDVTVEDGVVTLKGRALLSEIALVMESVSTLPGVIKVENHLKVRQDTQDINEPLESRSVRTDVSN